jgi:hypothetical protein
VSRATLDPSDPVAFGRWLAGLRSSFNDLDAAALDMLRAPGDRELGPALHRAHYHAAREQVLQALAFADGSEPGDPSGSGSSPAH